MLSPLPIDSLLPSVVEAVKRGARSCSRPRPGAGKTTRVPARAARRRRASRARSWSSAPPPAHAPRRPARRRGAGRARGRDRRLPGPLRGVASAATRAALRHRGRAHPAAALRSRAARRGRGGAGRVPRAPPPRRPRARPAPAPPAGRAPGPQARGHVRDARAAPVARYLGERAGAALRGPALRGEPRVPPAAGHRHLEPRCSPRSSGSRRGSTTGDVLVFLPGAGGDPPRPGGLRRVRRAPRLPACSRSTATCRPPSRTARCGRGAREDHPLHQRRRDLGHHRRRRRGHRQRARPRRDRTRPGAGCPSLQRPAISRASAAQRAGRAGRTRAGDCLRLYTQHDFDGRPEQDAPEICPRRPGRDRARPAPPPASPTRGTFRFFEPPPAAALEAAEELLRGSAPRARRTGAHRARPAAPLLPGASPARAHPASRASGAASRPRRPRGRACSPSGPSRPGPTLGGARRPPAHAERPLGRAGADGVARLRERARGGAAQAVERTTRQLSRARCTARHRAAPAEREDALLLALLAGFPDRVARRRKPHAPELVLSGGGSAILDPVERGPGADAPARARCRAAHGPRGPRCGSGWPAPSSPSGCWSSSPSS